MNEVKKDELSLSNELEVPEGATSGAQEMAELAEKAQRAVEKVERERDEYRSLYAKANGEILKQKEEIRYLKDRVANREAESLRQTSMAREKMNIQLQKDASARELNELLNSSFNNSLEARRAR